MIRFDLRQSIVPFSLLQINSVFKEMAPGGVIEVLWNDPVTISELFRILPAFSYRIRGQAPVEGETQGVGEGYRLEVEKIEPLRTERKP